MMEAIARIRALPLPFDAGLGSGVCELIEIDSEPKPSPGMVPDRCMAGLEGISVSLVDLAETFWTGLPITMREFVPAWKTRDSPLRIRLLEALGTSPFAASYTTNASAPAALGIPVFILGPGSIEQAHAIDEWLALDQLNAAVRAYEIAIRTCLKPE